MLRFVAGCSGSVAQNAAICCAEFVLSRLWCSSNGCDAILELAMGGKFVGLLNRISKTSGAAGDERTCVRMAWPGLASRDVNVTVTHIACGE
jgi:hypothetical protein